MPHQAQTRWHYGPAPHTRTGIAQVAYYHTPDVLFCLSVPAYKRRDGARDPHRILTLARLYTTTLQRGYVKSNGLRLRRHHILWHVALASATTGQEPERSTAPGTWFLISESSIYDVLGATEATHRRHRNHRPILPPHTLAHFTISSWQSIINPSYSHCLALVSALPPLSWAWSMSPGPYWKPAGWGKFLSRLLASMWSSRRKSNARFEELRTWTSTVAGLKAHRGCLQPRDGLLICSGRAGASHLLLRQTLYLRMRSLLFSEAPAVRSRYARAVSYSFIAREVYPKKMY